jgi:hypothetical protein
MDLDLAAVHADGQQLTLARSGDVGTQSDRVNLKKKFCELAKFLFF